MRGLGTIFQTFADIRMAMDSLPSFVNLVTQARDHEIHHKLTASNKSSASSVAFFAGFSRSDSHGGSSNGFVSHS